jgi:hypothetical protein
MASKDQARPRPEGPTPPDSSPQPNPTDPQDGHSPGPSFPGGQSPTANGGTDGDAGRSTEALAGMDERDRANPGSRTDEVAPDGYSRAEPMEIPIAFVGPGVWNHPAQRYRPKPSDANSDSSETDRKD